MKNKSKRVEARRDQLRVYMQGVQRFPKLLTAPPLLDFLAPP